MRALINILFLSFLLLWLPKIVLAQTQPDFYDPPFSHLEWFTIESDNFYVHFQEGNSRTAKITSRIAEEVFPLINELYQYAPDEKVSIVLKDREDYSNGAAYFFDNKIDIWVPALDTPLRGTHNWLRNVITHEYTHIVQIQKGMKRKRKFPVSYIQWLSYEDVRRPDVLYGFPNGIITLPFASINIPAWLAEGTAQYQRTGLSYETWDSHRDMILRTRILSDTYFTLEEMGTFASKTSIERETVYNQGYAFVIYLADRFGEDILRELTTNLGQKGVYKVEEALELSTGIPGKQIFSDWIEERKEYYKGAVENLSFSDSDYLEKEGFFNFHPRPSPDGKSIAYVSNKGRDYSLASLYIKTNNETIEVATVSNLEQNSSHNHADALNPTIRFISSSFSFSPDGSKLIYGLNKRTEFGESYNDLFLFDIESRKNTRLTNGARIDAPTFSPNGDKIAAVQYSKGTQNLVLVDLESKEIQHLTQFKNGETVYTPSWHPNSKQIFYSYADFAQRSIRVFNFSDNSNEIFLSAEYKDFRDPFVSADGNTLFYSSNPDGIFNIYHTQINDSSEYKKLTSVLGGAFMPAISSDNILFFSEYETEGYKIKFTELTPSTNNQLNQDFGFYDPAVAEVPSAESITINSLIDQLNSFNDQDLSNFNSQEMAVIDTGTYSFDISTLGNDNARTVKKYEPVYTKAGFYPTLRFDNYTKKNGNNGTLIKNGKFGKLVDNLLRDVKPGVYFSSRDMLDKVTVFGGALFGVGSLPAESVGGFLKPDRLFGLDRDLFLIAEYRGLPFIDKFWSPTVAIELYNLRRNVENGLTIEEFPCTSCLPENSFVDISYDIWEANLFLRSKLSRRSLLEFGLGYSPYTVNTDNFFSRELNQLLSGTKSQYFRGTTFSVAHTYNYYEYSVDADIAPIGLKGYTRLQYQPASLLDEYEIKDGSLIPIYKTTKNTSAEIHFRYGFKAFGNQAFQARVRGFSFFNTPDDAFYTDYIGGFLGMRSYPYFAIGGDRTAFTSISWFTPIIRNINQQYGPYSIDKVFARFFYEAGNAWNSPFETGSSLKSGIGAELRVSLNGYYLFPLRLFVSGAYGFNEFELTLPDDFVTTDSQSNTVKYGKQFQLHFGLTFDFDLL